ncbi:MAG: NAD(P)H-dependent oxidoreductase [Thermodesulfobacteriota bacterium]
MNRFLEYAGWVGFSLYSAWGASCHFRGEIMRPVVLVMLLVLAPFLGYRRVRGQASDLDLALIGYFFLAALGFWLFPQGLGRIMAGYPLTVLYAGLFLTAAAQPLVGAAPFTTYFARKTTPAAVWETPLFQEINRRLTYFWASLFALNALVTLVPHLWPGMGRPWLFTSVLPLALILGVGFPVTKWYPGYRRRQLGLPAGEAAQPTKPAGPGAITQKDVPIGMEISMKDRKEEDRMSFKYQVAALNGSPHEGFGNTSQMLAMLKEHLAEEGFALEEIFLSQQQIEYCTGCAVCLEKGACWIRDDHKGVVKRLLDADAVILASPVYFHQVTGQMKTFLDRSLGYGHRPRGTWKPGLAVSVSAGWGETQVAQYLAGLLGVYGAFAVGQLTAIAVGPGAFWGKEAVEARAGDLARDLARAVKEGRRYPPTDRDLDYWHFMGGLIKENRDFMKADFEHWQKLGILDSLEAYIGQSRSPASGSPEMRAAWLKSLMARQQGAPGEAPLAAAANPGNPGSPQTARELLEAMPGALNAEAAAGLTATFQFEVSGGENFTAHLRIDNGAATFQEGPASQPDVIIKTPADVWLAIARGEMDGAAAFMTGKFQVEGDLGLLMQMESLFRK